ncbi:(2Fe-2S)-binding protein [Streptomyces sp. 205]|uniref:(2Fe-2S)-binding protein n=2 Tax=Streptomyces coffeae TaxID=621382 RepID=A0ABS1NF41_9ACTN|nr:(2Fe-2S)-binding protein [Streptomyces coffeae]
MLREAAAVGPFFALRTGGAGPRAEGYVPLGAVYRTVDGRAAPPLLARIDAVATTLRTDERRVAASLVFQGLAARLWSLALAPAALHGRVPELRPDRLWWNPARMAPDDLWHPDPLRVHGEPAGLAGQLAQTAYVHLRPLHHAVRAACPVSGRLLWGNAASALAGSLRVLHDWCRAQGRGDAADRATALVHTLFQTPPLSDTGTLTTAPLSFRRRTCCLYYRVPGGGLCGDCVLHRIPRAERGAGHSGGG